MMRTSRVSRSFKNLTNSEQDMVTSLAVVLSASKRDPERYPVNYTSKDVCELFGLSRTSYAAVQANISRYNS